jgi:hypothetical protein
MITAFIVESVVMFAAGWLFAMRFYDQRLKQNTEMMNKASAALAHSHTLNEALTACLDAATKVIETYKNEKQRSDSSGEIHGAVEL